VEAFRRQLIIEALAQAHGNRAAAAKALGLQRTYLSRLIKTLRISSILLFTQLYPYR
ncbi:MAG TPA: helix-turn-helix domain-containing protein, partial [Acidobacteriota bacterium]|nr:helix-turn-helix domain-containing protein [Acidobacteriota bacterium]